MSITATLYVDGVRVADGADADDPDAPTALAGLSITWGRSTTIDQPEPSTCTFEVMDQPGGQTFLGLLYVGAAVAVRAAGTVQAPPVLPINTDTSFEAAALGAPPATWDVPPARSAIVFRGNPDQVHTGAQAVAVLAADPPGAGASAIVARPAPGSSPAAWDDLPTTRLGENWATSLWWRGPLGARLAAGLVYFTGPAAAGVKAPPVTATSTGAAAWAFLEARTVIGAAQAGQWVGQFLDVTWPTWAAGQGSWADYPDTWNDAAVVFVDDQEILAPESAGAVSREVLVFAGRITDVDAGWSDSVGAVVCRVVAADFTADLANRIVADVPWPLQSVLARFSRIMVAADAAIGYRIDPTLSQLLVSWMDVDAQPALALLQDVATSVDGVLWSAVHQGNSPALYLADPAQLSALYRLDLVGGVVVIVPTAAADAGIVLDACDVLLDPVTFRQAASDVTTRVVLTWLEQTTDDGGAPAPTERTVTVVDAPLELALGVRRLAVSTLLPTLAAATAAANRLLARLHKQSWRVSGVVFDTATTDLDTRQTASALDLLDGVRRLNAPVILTNLPDWSPAGDTLPLFLQGGTYTYDAGAWALDLTTASAQSQGTSLAWNQLDPGWAWNQFDPAIAWTDLYGVAP